MQDYHNSGLRKEVDAGWPILATNGRCESWQLARTVWRPSPLTAARRWLARQADTKHGRGHEVRQAADMLVAALMVAVPVFVSSAATTLEGDATTS